MKNLRKLTKKSLKAINGGAGSCPQAPIRSCDVWCGLSPLEKFRCIFYVEQSCSCN
ncbi:hypothetical protein MP478_17585 [Chryseobacterium sp. WG14]|uniref:bacteriocin-like protein n=1 Tax=unclassified Chryseobacterium TaxID=2593645 RepID=UPI001E313AFA|nr:MULTISPECIES: hypothetical protein [unclassified Chryseobacterium]MCQ9634514.1 hypothetical protein [Chryseobacterium sp. WG23]MCQ9641196.1 hypothetical protein [Chryseobacterium sp. WG14]